MAEPLVSVVVPVYNVERYLDRCLESIVGQTYSNLEILLVDDGSTDHCPVLCDHWAEQDGRIRVIHRENAGLGIARNAGMALAGGQYICFFDSDDYVDRTTIEKCVASAEACQSDVVVFGRWDVPEAAAPVPRPVCGAKGSYQGEEILHDLLPGMLSYRYGFGVSACGKMYRLALLREYKIRFPSEREIISEDAWFALELFQKVKQVSIIPECLYYYVRRDSSLSRRYLPDRQKRNDAFLEQGLHYIRRNHLQEAVAVHLQVRYHGYTLAALKQTMTAGLPTRRKGRALREILTSPVLHTTLEKAVLAEEKRTMRMFFQLVKYRQYGLCRLLLLLKMGGRRERDV